MAAQPTQNLLILVMIILLGVAIGYFYYSSYVLPAQNPVAPPPISQADDLKAFEGLQIDFGILANKKFQSLQIFGESPVNPGATGKKDLFFPF